jgi:hypothetical protein
MTDDYAREEGRPWNKALEVAERYGTSESNGNAFV